MIEEVFALFLDKNPSIFVCGPTPFVEVTATSFKNLGFNAEKIKTERFS